MQLSADRKNQLIATVRHNCAISDAQFASYYSLCIYLLKMRELYRWEAALEFGVPIAQEAIGNWLDQKEQHWDRVEHESFRPVVIDNQQFDPFDQHGINALLQPAGLVYGAGYGQFGKPIFVLADLDAYERSEGYSLYIGGREYARELVAPPAMAANDVIFVRRQSLRRAVAELVDEWHWQTHTRSGKPKKHANQNSPLGQWLTEYQFTDDNLDEVLAAVTNDQIESVILHEIGELVAGQCIHGDWNAVLLSVTGTKAEAIMRAVRDLLADCLSVLPALLHEKNLPAIHFYFANFSALRSELFPALRTAYQEHAREGDLDSLKSLVCQGQRHWLGIANRMVACGGQEHDAAAAACIESLSAHCAL